MKDRGKKQGSFHVLKKSNMPALLTESGFIDNKSDAALLKTDTFIENLAQGHVNGLKKAFGLVEKAHVVTVKKERVRIVTGTFTTDSKGLSDLEKFLIDRGWKYSKEKA